MSSEPDLFTPAIPRDVETLFFGQLAQLFYEHHWRFRKESKNAAPIFRYLCEHFYGVAVHTMRGQNVDNCMAWLASEKNQGAWSLIKARSLIRLMFMKAEEWREDGGVGDHSFARAVLPKRNPGRTSKPIKPPPPIQHATPWEYRAWIKAARAAGDRKLVAALRIGIWCRLSPADLLMLDESEIDEGKFEIRVRRRHTRTPRNPAGVLQVCHLTEKIWGEIAVLRQFRKAGVTRLVDTTNLRRRLAKVRKAAAEKGVTLRLNLRVLRRSAAQHLRDAGFDDSVIAEALAHTTTKMVRERYTVGPTPHLKRATRSIVAAFDE